MHIFKFFTFMTIVFSQNANLIINSNDSSIVMEEIRRHMDKDPRISVIYELESFDFNESKSIYTIIDNKKMVDSLFIDSESIIKNKILKQILTPYKNTPIGGKYENIGIDLVNRYYFLNKEPQYQLGLVENRLAANIIFQPTFNSHYSGIIGLNRMQKDWKFNGEVNLHMENYFLNAEYIDIFWRRLDSLSQKIKLGFLLPHPFGWNTGINYEYEHEIINGLFTKLENRYLLKTFFPIFNNIGFGIVRGRSIPTKRGIINGYTSNSYEAFTLTTLKDNTNHRFLPSAGSVLKLEFDGGIDKDSKFLNSYFHFNTIYPLTNFLYCKFQFVGKGINYFKGMVPKSRYSWFGGNSKLRGYNEQAFTSPQYQISSFELGYKPEINFEATIFLDIGSDKLDIYKNNYIGYGFGITQMNDESIIKLEYGLSSFKIKEGMLHIKWISRI